MSFYEVSFPLNPDPFVSTNSAALPPTELTRDNAPDNDTSSSSRPMDSQWVLQDAASSSGSSEIPAYVPFWKTNFISSRGNEYFCEIDEEYLTDRFNLTGIQQEVQYYQYALDLVTDVFDLDCEDEMRETIEKSARHLYGMVHQRYIVTTRGLAKMVEKFKKSDFGKCPRVMCEAYPLLPLGLEDRAGLKSVKLHCAKCEDIYNPKSSRHAAIDGAYFGSSFHSILFTVYPALIPTKSIRRYEPKIFGFKMHAAAALARYQDTVRDEMKERLKAANVEGAANGQVFIEDMEEKDDKFRGGDAMEGVGDTGV